VYVTSATRRVGGDGPLALDDSSLLLPQLVHDVIAREPVSVHVARGWPLVGMVLVAALVAGCDSSPRTTSRPGRVSTTPTLRTTVAATTTTTVAPSIYRIKRGDTLTRLAKQFRVSISDIEATNHLTNPDRLTEGQDLVIPPAPRRKLAVMPGQGSPGQAFQFTLTGAVPAERISFTIESPAGKYTGGPHAASPEGTVTATYNTGLDAPTGSYTVTGTGNLGTTIRAGFLIVAPPSTDHT
jgi:LysM repeat protein